MISFFSILCVALVFIVCSPFVRAQECKTSPCPEPFGSCNQCYIGIEGVFPVTRKVCGYYDQEKCKKAFGNRFPCNDGVNSCICVHTGVISTKIGAAPYNHDDCIQTNGQDAYLCAKGKCLCTCAGIGYRPF